VQKPNEISTNEVIPPNFQILKKVAVFNPLHSLVRSKMTMPPKDSGAFHGLSLFFSGRQGNTFFFIFCGQQLRVMFNI